MKAADLAALRLIFDDPPRSVSDWLAGKAWTYNLIHGQIPKVEKMIAKEDRRLRR